MVASHPRAPSPRGRGLARAVAALALAGCAAAAPTPAAPAAALTVYAGHAVVRDVRRLPVAAGEQEIDLGPVPTAATAIRLEARGARVVAVTRRAPPGPTRARVEADGVTILLENAEGEEVVPEPSPSSALRALLVAPAAGEAEIEAAYATSPARWEARYVAVIDGDGVELRGVATVHAPGLAARPLLVALAAAGRVYEIVAPLVLVGADGVVPLVDLRAGAGTRTLLLVSPPPPPFTGGDIAALREGEAPPAEGVAEQIELALPRGASALPPGQLTVLRREPDGSLTPVGSQRIWEIAPDKPLRVSLGPAAGVRAARRQVDLSGGDRRLVEEVEIRMTSTLGAPALVTVIEHLREGGRTEVAWASHPEKREGTSRTAFHVAVPAGGEARLRFRLVTTR